MTPQLCGAGQEALRCKQDHDVIFTGTPSPRSTGREITRRNPSLRLPRTFVPRKLQPTDAGHLEPRQGANKIDHPRSAYLREDQISGPLDAWLAEVFEPGRLEYTLTQLENAQPDNTLTLDAARQALTEYDQKLTRHRA
ncbi:hypothetical protein ACW9HQ_36950, partial [Nocardia gipuzkoensis]